jgi:hypothetical protein
MQKSKLAEVFYALSATEKTALRKFVQSVYYNKREDVQRLHAYMEQFEHAHHPALSKDKVFSYVFPDAPYSKSNEQDLRYVMSFLLKLIEEFLTTEEAMKDELVNHLKLARVYRRMRLPKHFKQELRKARKMHQKSPLRDFEHYEVGFQIEQEEYIFTGHTERSAPRNLQALSDMLDIQYIAAKLKQSCLLLAHQTMYKISYETGLLAPLLHYVSQNEALLEEPAIALYYFYYQAVTTAEGEAYFKKFKKLLLEEVEAFPEDEMRDLYQFAINFCIRKVNLQAEGYEQYFEQMLDLYKVGLKHQFLLQDGELSPFAFKNIVSTALWLQQFDWTNSFILNYQDYLNPRIRETYVNFAYSKLKFEQKDYDEALLLLQQVDYSDIFLNLNSKVMLLKIYYELDEYDVLESFLNSFKTYVNRKKKSGDLRSYHQENFLNIIRFTHKLLTYNPFSKKEKQRLKAEIEATKVLTERSWLLAQL